MRFLDVTQTIPRDIQGSGLKVIAAGQWRCATSSLQTAFEQILQPPLAPSMHGAVSPLDSSIHRFIANTDKQRKYCMPSVSTMKLLTAAMLEQDSYTRRSALHQVFHGYNASSDWPGFAFVDDLLDMYPEAKVILNKRHTAEEWQRSVRSSLAFFSTRWYFVLTYWVPVSYWHYQMYRGCMQLAKRRYGINDLWSVECYERHNAWVRSIAAARGKEILEWEPADGWTPLCGFVGRAVPDEAFPRTNETAEIEKLKVVLIKNGLLAWAKALSAATIIAMVGVLLSLRWRG